MASKELEVLDPAAPVDTLTNNAAGRALNRRNLMAGLGMAGAAVGASLLSGRGPKRPGVVHAAPSVEISEIDYLNFLLNLKYLQATFYAYITQGTDLPAGKSPLTATITNISATATTLTVTAANSFPAGQTGVTISGLTSITGPITSISATATTATIAATNTFGAGQTVAVAGLTTAAASISGVSATPTTVTITSPSSFTAGQTVTISGLTVASANITSVAATTTTVTVTATNTFAAGQTGVIISGLTGALAAYNGSFTIATATSSSFTISFASAGVSSTTVPSGTAAATLSLAAYNGTFTIATATSSSFTFVLASSPVLSTVAPVGAAVITIPVSQYNGTFKIVTATASNFTYAFTTPLPFGAAAVPTGTAVATVSLAAYNGVFTIATATSTSFTIALAGPALGSTPITTPAYAVGPYSETNSSPYSVNGSKVYPVLGGNPVTNPITAPLSFTSLNNGQQITDMLNEIYYDELNQLIDLQNLINNQVLINGQPALTGQGAIIRPVINLNGGGSITNLRALAMARLIEDVTVTAFAGAIGYLTGANLQAVSQMLAVDGFHAGALRLAIIQQNIAQPSSQVPLFNGDSDIVPAQAGEFWLVQPDDVTTVDSGTSAATGAIAGPQVATTPQFNSTGQNIDNPCTAPIVPFSIVAGSSTTYSSCTPTQYQGFFATAGAATYTGSTPPGFAFARTPAQVLSILYASSPGATPVAPGLPNPNTNPLTGDVTSGGFFPSGVLPAGQLSIIVA